MTALLAIYTDNVNLEKELCCTLVSNFFRLKLNKQCYYANNLHEKYMLRYTQLCLTYASVDQLDGYSTFFWQPNVIWCFPNVVIHIYYTQLILRQFMIVLCNMDISY